MNNPKLKAALSVAGQHIQKMVIVQELNPGNHAWGKAKSGQELKLNNDLAVLEKIVGKNDLSGLIESFVLIGSTEESYSAETIRGYRNKLSLLVRFLKTMGITQPEQVTENHIRLFIKSKQETIKAVSVNTLFRAYRRWFNWMVEKHILQVSPMAGMKTPKVPKTVIQPFSHEQINALLDKCDNSFLGLRNKAIILTFYDTGLRLHELAGIRLSQIDVERGCIKVLGKGAKERYVGIGKQAQKAIFQYLLLRRDSQVPFLWVTEEKNKPLHSRGISKMLHSLGIAAGLQGVRCSPHTFRHTFGTDALRNGASVFEVQSLLGHSTLSTTRRYTETLNSEQAIINHKRFSPGDNLK